MTESKSLLEIIREISAIDIAIASVDLKRKEIEKESTKRKEGIVVEERKVTARRKLLDEKKTGYNREEKSLKDSREKITDRRKALGTLGNHKLQEAAEREIDFQSKQLSGREDLLIGLLTEISAIEKDLETVEKTLNGYTSELEALQNDAKTTLVEMEAKANDDKARKAELVKGLTDKTALQNYERVRNRYPHNPLAEMKNGDSCAACFMKVGPQVLQQVAKGEVAKCPGCGRILFSQAQKV